VRRVLFATTAIILPDVSFTVPCRTNSGITRHRLPLVQFGVGRFTPSLATIGLTNGSLRPCAPKLLAEGLGFSAVFSAAVAGATLGAGGCAVPLGCVVDFLAGCVGFTAITAGFAAPPFVSVVFAPGFLASAGLAATTGVGAPLACVVAEALLFTGIVVVATCGLAPGAALLLGCVLDCAAAGLLPAVVVPDFVVADCVPVLAAFFVPAFVVLPDLLAADGVGDGVGVGWLWAPEFCAVAIVAMAVASARI